MSEEITCDRSGKHEAEEILEVRTLSGEYALAYQNGRGVSVGICRHCRCLFVEKVDTGESDRAAMWGE